MVTSTAALRATSTVSTGTAHDVVLAQHLDGALGAARCRGDEERGLAGVAGAAQIGDPIGNAAVIPRRHLRRDVVALGRVSAASATSSVSTRVPRPSAVGDARPLGEQRLRRRRRSAAPVRLGEAGVQRLLVPEPLIEHFVGFAHDQARAGPASRSRARWRRDRPLRPSRRLRWPSDDGSVSRSGTIRA